MKQCKDCKEKKKNSEMHIYKDVDTGGEYCICKTCMDKIMKIGKKHNENIKQYERGNKMNFSRLFQQ